MDLVKSISYREIASVERWVVKMRSYFLRSSVKHAAGSLYCFMVSHLAALLLLFAPHFLCGPIREFNTLISWIPTASAVRITAEILCGSNTFSSTTVRSFCLLSKTWVSRCCRSGVMKSINYFFPAASVQKKNHRKILPAWNHRDIC